ncbi:hypothetical protein AB0333_03235 [Citricoccus sp. NPDC079358]|uniref:hypothetical protein n=1 Tax=Citricoccus sp. NPDC079358 TaxID=3154653 RepID=UPI00344DBEA1
MIAPPTAGLPAVAAPDGPLGRAPGGVADEVLGTGLVTGAVGVRSGAADASVLVDDVDPSVSASSLGPLGTAEE